MSKEMKDFLSQFMNQPEPKLVEVVAKKKDEIKETKPQAEKKIEAKPEKKSVESKTAKLKAEKALAMSQKVADTEGVRETLSAEVFLQSINDKKYVFDKKKNLQIDDQLFSILNLLKQYGDIKSIATLLNAIVEKYIDDNKKELKIILSKNPLKDF